MKRHENNRFDQALKDKLGGYETPMAPYLWDKIEEGIASSPADSVSSSWKWAAVLLFGLGFGALWLQPSPTGLEQVQHPREAEPLNELVADSEPLQGSEAADEVLAQPRAKSSPGPISNTPAESSSRSEEGDNTSSMERQQSSASARQDQEETDLLSADVRQDAAEVVDDNRIDDRDRASAQGSDSDQNSRPNVIGQHTIPITEPSSTQEIAQAAEPRSAESKGSIAGEDATDEQQVADAPILDRAAREESSGEAHGDTPRPDEDHITGQGEKRALDKSPLLLAESPELSAQHQTPDMRPQSDEPLSKDYNWKAELLLGPSFNYRTFKAKANPELASHKNDNDAVLFSGNLSLMLRRMINERWSLATGIQSFNCGEKYSYTLHAATHKFDNDYRYLSIPLELDYRVWHKQSLSLEVGLGGQYNLLREGTSSWVDLSTEAPVTHNNKGDESPFSKGAVAFTSDLTLRYQLSSRIELIAQPRATYFTQSLYKKETGLDQRPYALGLMFGLAQAF